MLGRSEVPSQRGKRIVITGANTGIGRHTALELGRAGAEVILAGRSRERTEPVVEAIRRERGGEESAARFVELDLSDLESVRAGAEAILSAQGGLDVLINNAGLVGQRGVTAQGFELAFGVNHLGHFLLTMLLFERLNRGARVVHVASRAHRRVKGLRLERARRAASSPMAFREYCESKLANVLCSAELARRASRSGVSSHALHPGVIASDLWRGLPGPLRWAMTRPMISAEQGARTTLYCATSPELKGRSGRYYVEEREQEVSEAGRSERLASKLWEASVEWSGASVPQELRVRG